MTNASLRCNYISSAEDCSDAAAASVRSGCNFLSDFFHEIRPPKKIGEMVVLLHKE